jgi:uncharacterized protein (TIGR02246 family)
VLRLAIVGLTFFSLTEHCVRGQDQKKDAALATIQSSAEQLVAAFNEGKVDELASMFLPQGELIDEEGTIYRGEQEIKELLNSFFARFPETKLSIDIESIRLAGPVAIEEGTRTMTSKDGATQSRFRYIAVRSKTDIGWKLASIRDFNDDPVPSPHENLQPLAGLVGEWINEGSDGSVAISYRWSDDKNYLLGEFQVTSPGNPTTTSSQRIGWDPLAGKIRSWLFDADGGFSEGHWTIVDDGIVIKSSSVNPDGGTASATMTIVPRDKDHFSIRGSERIIGNSRGLDFEITVTRRPPSAGK